ncbi:hypothetical protein G7092_11925 [Mucilaginibacter sp. HC2]|uniref:hypothetical protein n=1 Tax=Mucilaginibacter inviolabilis TaxID=2714892 RepID=UPI00140BAEBD|nr:hypothetical protein [Mucilaginibacter inviolabilis]NHA04510.1 hypothetical protein [Mucilaginibacter inviolabilis]
MKLNLKILLVALAGTALFYTACRKEVKLNPNSKPPASKIDTASLATGQIIRNITQTLSGAYGGVNISKGLILPDLTTIRQSKPLIIGLVNLCSFFPDTVVNYRTVIGDTIKSETTGLFKFYFSCDTVRAPGAKYPDFTGLNGYVAYDSLATTGQTPSGLFVHNVKAFYEAKALDKDAPLAINGSANKLISFNNGSIKSFVDTASTKKTQIPSSIHAYYTLNNVNKVTVDLTKNGDITAGAIAFAAIGEVNGIKWYYEGVINFLGNHKASVVIKNKTYNVDLLTGKVTAT